MSNREFFLQLLSTEHQRFIAVIGAAPAAQLEYRPHPRSRSAFELIGHLIGHAQDLVELAETGEINHRMLVPFNGIDDALRIYGEAHETLKAKVGALEDAAWTAKARFLAGGHLVMEAPRGDLAWTFLLDAVHHRGQLSTYLRPMGGTVPAIYGPSADSVVAQA